MLRLVGTVIIFSLVIVGGLVGAWAVVATVWRFFS